MLPLVLRCGGGRFCSTPLLPLLIGTRLRRLRSTSPTGAGSPPESRRHICSTPARSILAWEPSDTDVLQFQREGFLVKPDFLPTPVASRCRERVAPLFAGDFSTSVYPDEWHWRPGLSRDDVTREICNAWKSDHTFASVVLSESVGRVVAKLCGWPGTKIAQDDVFWKPPTAKALGFHRDGDYFDFLKLPPSRSVVAGPGGRDGVGDLLITCWMALDDVYRDGGSLEYVRGSHKWPRTARPVNTLSDGFHAIDDYRAPMLRAAAAAGISDDHVDIVHVEVPAGGVAFHHPWMWHGSGQNKLPDNERRALAIHAIHSECVFAGKVGYTFGRYKHRGSDEMHDDFFPTTFSDGTARPRSPWIGDHCQDAFARAG